MSSKYNEPKMSSTSSKKRLWRGPAEYAGTAESEELLAREFPPGASELEMDGVSRRRFMGLMGASAAFAGATLTGCIRKPKQRIVPASERPEDVIPGKPRYFRTALNVGPRVVGVHVESQDGRPTKVEGNPLHPMSQGKTDAWAQASVLDLYDPARTKAPLRNGNPSTWSAFAQFMTARATAGGMAFVVDSTPSPTLHRLAAGLERAIPGVRFFQYDGMGTPNADAALDLIGAGSLSPSYDLAQAKVVLSVDCDIFGVDGDSVRNTQRFMQGRNLDASFDIASEGFESPEAQLAGMNRLYVVEPGLTVTGISADNRLPMAASRCGAFLAAVAKALSVRSTDLAAIANVQLGTDGRSETPAWAQEVAADLSNAGPGAVVMVGERQPAWVHALAHLVNHALGSSCVTFAGGRTRFPNAGSIDEFVRTAASGQIKTAVFLGSNPVYGTSAETKLREALGKIEASVHLGMRYDETAQALVDATREAWHLPQSHYLESWGDLRASDGTLTIQQPLVAPLWGSLTAVELLHALGKGQTGVDALANPESRDAGHEVVKQFSRLDDTAWKEALHYGVVGYRVGTGAPARAARPQFDWSRVSQAMGSEGPLGQNTELVFQLDYSVGDGRWANNAWLQEMPDPITKLTWDNALLMNPRTAERFGVNSGQHGGQVYTGDLADATVGDKRLRAPVFVVNGIADNVVVMSVGYGRSKSVGEVATGSGFDANELRPAGGRGWVRGISLANSGETYPLATTQEHWSLSPRVGYEERDIIEYFDRDEFLAEPDAVLAKEAFNDHHVVKYRLFEPSEIHHRGQQWAMVIDLTKCTGCSACVVACQAENNIPVVGKERVLNGREMHWIRIDRYWTGTMEAPGRVVVNPVPCMQCETAPCEQVCPVAATQHSPEGLNDMAYNRCIGTRYCANNCPYKVRRFNFFNFQKENGESNPLLEMVRNPDVTVRFRGVMEKCTYCTQRISEARIDAKVNGDGVIPIGGVQTACQQACPADAIVFGDKLNPADRAGQLRGSRRHYNLLAYLNVLPRTTFLAQIRNPNPKLAEA